MTIKLNEPLSKLMRQFLRDHLREMDLEIIAERHGLSWTTLRALRRKYNPPRVTAITEPCIIPMVETAIRNKAIWATQTKEEVQAYRTQIKAAKNALKISERAELKVRQAANEWSANKYLKNTPVKIG